jgi:lipoyl(octanoyl) transferase 2
MKLRHVSFPGLSRYTVVGRFQQKLVTQFLSHKQALRAANSHHAKFARANISEAPYPTILTAQFQPVYTAGLRENIPAADVARLESLGAEVHHTSRGGQITFHGPGQLVAYPILDMQAHNLTTPCYVHMLEAAVMGVCARYGVKTRRTGNVGVWTGEGEDERKIAAVGVRLRRFVTSHGVGLNVNTDLKWFEHIVACGLADKEATSLKTEGVTGLDVETVGKAFVDEIAKRLDKVDGVVNFPLEQFEKELELTHLS